MGAIGHRDCGSSVADLARADYDVIVVGGGIYGAMLHLEAARLGLRSVLVERGDFGGATSENSMRIVHGGLRYLQNLNVARSVESTRERQWYLSSLPRLVSPLPCLLPIYERGRKRTSVLTLGLAANDALSAAVLYLDCSVADVPRGQLLDARGALELAPAIPADGLVGGAVWHDLSLRCPGRVIVEALKWAADLGGVAVNYVEARRLVDLERARARSRRRRGARARERRASGARRHQRGGPVGRPARGQVGRSRRPASAARRRVERAARPAGVVRPRGCAAGSGRPQAGR